jgi:hypothetical protein
MIAVLSHLSSLVATVLSATFLSFVAPLIFWLFTRISRGTRLCAWHPPVPLTSTSPCG